MAILNVPWAVQKPGEEFDLESTSLVSRENVKNEKVFESLTIWSEKVMEAATLTLLSNLFSRYCNELNKKISGMFWIQQLPERKSWTRKTDLVSTGHSQFVKNGQIQESGDGVADHVGEHQVGVGCSVKVELSRNACRKTKFISHLQCVENTVFNLNIAARSRKVILEKTFGFKNLSWRRARSDPCRQARVQRGAPNAKQLRFYLLR